MSGAKRYDVVVIGGGPAGATAAYILSKREMRVCLLEKESLPRFKLCAGLITQKTVQILENIFGISIDTLESQGILNHQSRQYGIFNLRKALVYGRCDNPFRFVERRLYDFFFLNQAKEAGAEIVSEEKAVSIDIANSRVITHRQKYFEGKFIVGADGVFSLTRAALARAGKIPDTAYRGIGLALETFIPKTTPHASPNFPALYFGFNPWGYAWAFPGKNHHLLGMCSLKKKNSLGLKRAFENFLRTLGIEGLADFPVKGYAVPYGNYLANPGFQNILLAGDAAGLADPLLGEGIFYAHQSGAHAAQAILEFQQHPRQAARSYSTRLDQGLLVEMRWARNWRGFIHILAKAFGYETFGFFVRHLQKEVEETIHGTRTFRWLRTKQPS